MKERMSAQEFRQMNAGGTKKRTNKYNAVKTVVDDIVFDSIRESERYSTLMWKYKKRMITKPLVHYVFFLTEDISYESDFFYFDCEQKVFVVEDSKGMRTPEYKLKKKLMKSILGLIITEV